MISFLLYLITASLICLKVLIRPGVIIGGDWGLAITPVQMAELVKNSWYTWTNQGNMLGDAQYFHNNLPYIVYTWLLHLIKVPPQIYTKSFLLLPLTFLGYSFYKFLRHLKVDATISFIGGVIYMTSPVFFDFAIIGWIYVLFAMAMLPLSLVALFKSVETNSRREATKAGLYFVLAMLQAQSIVWFPLLYLASFFYLVHDRITLRRFLNSLSIISIVLLSSLTLLWLPLFFGGGSGLSLKLGLSRISLGTWERINYLNILRNWGGLFNYQFETSFLSSLTIFSFALPLLATISLVFIRHKRLQIFIWLPVFIFLTLFTLGPAWITRLPLADVFRDISRFSVLASFSYALAATLLLHYLWQKQAQIITKVFGFILFIFWLISIHPYILGFIAEIPKVKDYDMRLRTYSFPPSYQAVEELMAKEPYSKAIHIPWNILVNSKIDPRFRGYYSEMANVFATYSAFPGLLPVGDKNSPIPAQIATDLTKALAGDNIQALKVKMHELGAGWLISRNNLESTANIDLAKLYPLLDQDQEFKRYYSSQEITVYRLVKTPPIFFPPGLPDKSFTSTRVNPTEYQLQLHGVKGNIDLVLLESYHTGWQLHQKNIWTPSLDIKQEPIFTFANHWRIDVDKFCLSAKASCSPQDDGLYDLTLIASFKPQRLFLIGLTISLISLFFSLSVVLRHHDS